MDVAEALMGYEGYLTEVYRKYPDPERTLVEFYKQGEYLLTEVENMIHKAQLGF